MVEDLATGQTRHIATMLKPCHLKLFCVGALREGKVYGGTQSPANVFRYDLATRQTENLGRLTAGAVQVYDILDHPRGLFLASYPGGLDFYDPAAPVGQGNPQQIV